MRSTRPYIIVLLALSTAALGGLSWQQYKELIHLRAAMLNNEAATKALLAKIEQPKQVVAETQAAHTEETKKAEEPEEGPAKPEERRRGGREEQAAAIRAAMNTPEFQKAMALQNQGRVEAHFAALFKRLNLPPEALEKFKNLLAEKQNAVRDAMEVAREQGLNGRENRDQLREVIKQTQAELDESIRASIGDTAYNQYQQYEQTQPQRTTASQLTDRLSYTQTPLSDTQYDQLVSTLAASGKTQNEIRTMMGGGPGGPGGAAFVGGAIGGPGTTITNEVVTAASAYLSAAQLNSLQQMQAEQQAARKAQQLLRDARQNPRNGGTGTTTPATGTTTGGKP